MAKFYYPTTDELQNATPLNENTWMREFQGLILALANTSEGKDLLCIDDYGLPIIGMKKNVVLYDHGDKFMADFRVGAKWANVIRYRWQEIRHALERVNEIELSKRTSMLLRGQPMLVPAGAATITQYPDPHPENTSVDGQVHRDTGYPSGASETLSTIRSGSGTGANDSGTNGYFQLYATTTSDEFFNLCRCIYGFDTSAMGACDIDSATAHFVGNEGVNNLGTTTIALAGAAPASNTALVAADYNTIGAHGNGTYIGYGADNLVIGSTWNVGSYSNFTLNAAGEAYIKPLGVTVLAVLLEWDKGNSYSGISWSSEQVTHQGSLMSENTGTSSDPKLIVNYTPIPFIPRAIIF